MLLTKIFRTTISILTTGWLVTFICFSTSHLGNAHNLYFPKDIETQYSFTNSNAKTSDECPWTFAALMTLGDLSVSNNITIAEFDEPNTSELQQFSITNIKFDTNQRGPPAV